MSTITPDAVIEVRDIVRSYRMARTSLRHPPAAVHALRGVSFDVLRGEKLGIVGESGCGKSTLARLLLALDRPQSGDIRYEGHSLVGKRERNLRFLRKDVQIVFQDPMSSLDPRMRVRDIVLEPLAALRVEGNHRQRLHELMDAVGLPDSSIDLYPHQFSGGQRQRIAIARALASHPRVLVADEAVSALDVSVRAQILNLVNNLTRDFHLSLVFISHDLSVVRHLCDRVAVMHQGQIVEMGPTREVYRAPQHEYTRTLLASIPTMSGELPAAHGT